MYAGKLVEAGARTEEVVTDARMPYTAALILTTIAGGCNGAGLPQAIPGGAPQPDLWALPSGCAFHPRCQHRRLSFPRWRSRRSSPSARGRPPERLLGNGAPPGEHGQRRAARGADHDDDHHRGRRRRRRCSPSSASAQGFPVAREASEEGHPATPFALGPSLTSASTVRGGRDVHDRRRDRLGEIDPRPPISHPPRAAPQEGSVLVNGQEGQVSPPEGARRRSARAARCRWSSRIPSPRSTPAGGSSASTSPEPFPASTAFRVDRRAGTRCKWQTMLDLVGLRHRPPRVHAPPGSSPADSASESRSPVRSCLFAGDRDLPTSR